MSFKKLYLSDIILGRAERTWMGWGVGGIVWVLTRCEARAGNSARVWLAASSQAWEANNMQCDCGDLYTTAVKEGGVES